MGENRHPGEGHAHQARVRLLMRSIMTSILRATLGQTYPIAKPLGLGAHRSKTLILDPHPGSDNSVAGDLNDGETGHISRKPIMGKKKRPQPYHAIGPTSIAILYDKSVIRVGVSVRRVLPRRALVARAETHGVLVPL